MEKPGDIIWLSRKEGGAYEALYPSDRKEYERALGFHSFGLRDGREWDVVNGWRGNKHNSKISDKQAMDHVEGRLTTDCKSRKK